MSEEKPIPTNVVVKSEGIDPYKFMIANLSPVELAESVQNDPTLCWFTNCSIVTKSGQVTTTSNLKIDLENDILNATINVKEFNENDALNHAQLFTRIVFSMTTMRNCIDAKQTVIGWLIQNYSKELKQIPSLSEISGIYPSNYLAPSTKEIVKFFDLSNNQPTIAERIEGILMKFTLKTMENKEFTICAVPAGFYVNPEKIYKSLHLLVSSLSHTFRDNYVSISKRWCDLQSIERRSFNNPTFQNLTFFPGNDASQNDQTLHLFDQEVEAVMGNIDDVIESLPKDNFHDIYVSKVERAFIRNSIEGIINIKRGLIPPMNEIGSYYYHDLFIAPLAALLPFYEMKGGVDSIHRTIANDIHTYPIIKSLDSKFRVCRCLVIDYFNERWFVQCLVPGLIYGKAQIVHGYDTENRTIYNRNKEFDDFFKENSEKLGISPSKVKSTNEEIYSASDASGVIGSDGNKYIVDFHTVTPRDFNYPDPEKDHGKIIRSEAVTFFEQFRALSKHDEEFVKLGCKKENFYKSDNEEAMKKRAEILQNVEKVKFDINVLSVDSDVKEVPENIKEISKFIVDVLIPIFIEEHLVQNKFVCSGRSIVNEMHRRGINVRYLGEVCRQVKKVADNEVLAASAKIIEAEMIIRAMKYVHRHERTDIESFITAINRLTGVAGNTENINAVRSKIINTVNYKYKYEMKNIDDSLKNLIITGCLSSFGLTVLPRASVDKLTPQHVVDVEPRIKFAFTKSELVDRMVDVGTALYMAGDLKSSQNIFQSIVQESVDPFDKNVSTALFYLALAKVNDKEFDVAFQFLIRSLSILEHYIDQIDPEIIIRYTVLAQVSSVLNHKTLSYVLYVRAMSLTELLCPFHPYLISAAVSAADAASALDQKMAMTLLQKAIDVCEKYSNDKKSLAVLCHTAAMNCVKDGNERQGMLYEQKAVESDPENEDMKQTLEQIKALVQQNESKKHKKH